MKNFRLAILLSLSIAALSQVLYAQASGDVRSAQTGTWTSALTWEVYNGTAWVPATNPPSGAENITVKDTVSVSSVDVTIAGYIKIEGIGVLTVGELGTVTFTPTSTYEHARNAGTIPISTWAVGSTAKFTGVTSTAPGNRVQSFSHVIWDSPGQSSNLNMGWNNVTISGNVTINNTGTGRWYFAGPTTGTTAEFTVMGNVTHNAGNFATHGTGNGGTTIIVHHFGNITSNAGNFSICRGSQGNTGTTTWYLHGNLSLTNTETQNSNAAGAKFVFAGEEFRTLSLNNVTFGGGGLPLSVDSAAVVVVGENVIGGNGTFTVNDFGGVLTSHPDGLNGNLATLGIITLSPMGNYGFNGTSAQVTGALMQDTINGIYIDNPAGVTLSSNLLVNGWFTLSKGNIVPGANTFAYGSAASLSYEGEAPQTTSNLEFPAAGGPLNLRVNNNAGVILHAGRTINGIVQIESGKLNLNGNTLTLGPDALLEENALATVTGTAGKIITTRTLSAPNGVNVGGLGAVITSGVNMGATTIERFHLPRTSGNNESILRNFNIIPAVITGLNATFRFMYDESELNGIPENNLVLFSSANGIFLWSMDGGTVNTGNNFVELSGINKFSYHTLGDVANPLPVELTSFTANTINGKTVLEWRTATETQNRGWDVEKQSSNSWEVIGFVNGNGTSTEPNVYTFVDNAINNATVKYRLRQIDNDGKSSYSITIEAQSFLPDVFVLEQNYPNPFNPATKIKYSIPQITNDNSFVTLRVYDAIGNEVALLVNETKEPGVYEAVFNADNLSSGVYLYKLTLGKVQITKSMMLLK